MKSPGIHLSALVAMALTSAYADPARRDTPSGAATSPNPAQVEVQPATSPRQETLSGRLVFLFHYLEGDRPIESSWMNRTPAAERPIGGATAPSTTQTTPDQRTAASAAATTGTNALGSNEIRAVVGPPPPRAGTWGGQTLALVVSRASAEAISRPDETAYILVFDPKNSPSRSAFAKAHWIMAGRGHEVDLAPKIKGALNDQIPVRGRDGSAAADKVPTVERNVVNKATEPVAGNTTTAQAANQERGSWRPNAPSTDPKDGWPVTITGTILAKDGIMALEVASIEQMPASNAGEASTKNALGRIDAE